jgi:hypothetical protein
VCLGPRRDGAVDLLAQGTVGWEVPKEDPQPTPREAACGEVAQWTVEVACEVRFDGLAVLCEERREARDSPRLDP